MLTDADFKIVYSSGENEPLEFFFDALLESSYFDLGLGFFSSSAFHSLSLGFAYFISKGGKMRMFINNILSQEDKDAIEKGIYSNSEELIEKRIIGDIIQLEKILSKHDRHFFNCLSYLVSIKKLEIIAITPLNEKKGIAHPKFGIFKDTIGNKVAFSGSSNFSMSALQYNYEAISCYNNWGFDSNDKERVKYFEDVFSKIWEGKYSIVKKIPIESVKTSIQRAFTLTELEQLLLEEEELLQNYSEKEDISESMRSKINKLKRNIKKQTTPLPSFPDSNNPRPYQDTAVEEWINNNFMGLFEMATGTGKTITGLFASTKLRAKIENIFLLVLVPTISLAEQWVDEVKKFSYVEIILVSSTNPNWENELQSSINSFRLGTIKDIVIISTYDSYISKRFQEFYDILPEETMLLADEAHSMGAPEMLKKLPNKIKYRLALSATPHRHFDDSGTAKFLNFFNAASRSTFVFSMKEAIAERYLCQYKLTPHLATLNEEEYAEYTRLTKKIAQRAHFSKNKFTSTDVAMERMLQERRKILNRAEAKKQIVGSIIDQMQLKGDIHHTLVYCPEGIDANEDNRIIDDYGKFLAFDKGLRIAPFTGATPAEKRSKLLKEFDEGKIQCLLAMKCLDEGVDVKRTETAIFVSSSTNPRQYVQRRGRVLRVHDEKPFAYLHDIITVPPKLDIDDPKAREVDKIILTQEFRRYKEFAEDAVNYVEAISPILEICNEYEIEL